MIVNKTPYSILYLDLDNFKAYNDVYQFENGDTMIKIQAQTILEIFINVILQDILAAMISFTTALVTNEDRSYEKVYELTEKLALLKKKERICILEQMCW